MECRFSSINWGNLNNQINSRLIALAGTSCKTSKMPVNLLIPAQTEGYDRYIIGRHSIRVTGILEISCDCTWKFNGIKKSDSGVDIYNMNKSDRGKVAESLTTGGALVWYTMWINSIWDKYKWICIRQDAWSNFGREYVRMREIVFAVGVVIVLLILYCMMIEFPSRKCDDLDVIAEMVAELEGAFGTKSWVINFHNLKRFPELESKDDKAWIFYAEGDCKFVFLKDGTGNFDIASASAECLNLKNK